MSKTILAMVAAAAMGTTLLMPDIAGAEAGGVNAAPGAGSSSGLRGSPAAGPRSGRRGGAAHRRGGAAGRHGAVPGRRYPGVGYPGWAVGASETDVGVPLYEYAPGLPPNCVIRRMAFDDDDGWRVRDMVVCPQSSLTGGL
jgi:hypothetical protein